MWKYIPFLFLFVQLAGCSGEKDAHENSDSLKDTAKAVSIPQFDITGEFEAGFMKGETEKYFDKNLATIAVKDLQPDDSLYINYKAANPCEECRVEYQIWRNDKYVDLVRDTGFGGDPVYIPAKLLLEASKFGTPEYSELGIYMSVHQYHPVETGNKRFLFYVNLK
jgi:hypothetical protein